MLCSCESQRNAGIPIELMVNQDEKMYFIPQAHVIIFGNVELYAFERSNLLCMPLDTIMQIIGRAASESLLNFINDSNIELLSLDSIEAMLLQQKCGFNRNNSCLDLISIEDFQNFCKKFTSLNISNSVIVEFALNSPRDKNLHSHVLCFDCGLLKPVRAMEMKDNEISSNYLTVPEDTLEYDLTELSVGFVNIGNTKMEAFAMRDNVYVSFKEIISYNILQLFQIQKGMRELHVLPIRAPVEVNDFLTDGKSLNINTFWIDVETVHSLVIKCRKRRKQTNPCLITCLSKREYKYYSIAMISCRNLDLTVHSTVIDSKSLELVSIEQDTLYCVIQKDEPFVIIDKTVNVKKLALHKNCIGCCLKMKENKPKRREKQRKEMLPIPENGLGRYCFENQPSQARAKKKKRKDSDINELSDDLTAALAFEPGDYIISDYDKFCELLQSRGIVGKDNSSSNQFTIYSEDDVACEFIKGETECGNEFKDMNNNLLGEAMLLCGINRSENANNLLVNKSNSEVNFDEYVLASNVLNSNENYLVTDNDVSDLCRPNTAATWDMNGDDVKILIEENIKKYLVFSRVNDTFRFEKFKDGAKTAFPALFWPTPDNEETLACRRAFIKSAEVKMAEWWNREESHENSSLSTRNYSPKTREIMLNNRSKNSFSNRRQTRKRKLCDGLVGSSNAINSEQKKIKMKRKDTGRKQSGDSFSSKNKRKNGKKRKCARKVQKSAKDIDIEDSFDESFRIEIFESKQVQKIIVRNWNKFTELEEHVKENKSKIKEKCVGSINRDVRDRGIGITNGSQKKDIMPDLIKYQNVIIDMPQSSVDRFTVNRYSSPIKMNRASDNDWIADYTSYGVQLNCYIQLTRMKWLDKLSQRLRVS